MVMQKKPVSPATQDEESLDSLFKKWGEKRGIRWTLLKGIAITESSLNPDALGDNGRSYGLMQIQFPTAKFFGVQSADDLFDPETNIMAGSGFLADLLSRHDEEEAIQAYNLGETKFNAGKISPDYLAKVQKNEDSILV